MPRNLYKNENTSQENKSKGLVDRLANNPLTEGILGAGDAVRDTMSLGATQNNPSGSGAAYNIGNIGGNIASFIGGGELADLARGGVAASKMGGLSKSAEYLGQEGLPSALKRIIGSGGYGAAVNPQDRSSGAEEGIALGGLGESVPYIGKALNAASEYITPIKYVNNKLGDIKQVYQETKDRVKQLMEPIREKFAGSKIYGNKLDSAFLNLPEDVVNQLSPSLRTEYKNIAKNPEEFTFNQAHEFQQKLGNELGDAMSSLPTIESKTAIRNYKTARDMLKNDMTYFLRKENPQLANQWKYGSDLHRDEVQPFRSDTKLHSVVEGKTKSMKPKVLQSSLEKMKESDAIPEGHYLSQVLEDVTGKIQKGELAGTAASIAGGGVAGGMMGPMGAGGGAIAGKYLAPYLMEFASNPEFNKMAQKLKPLYDTLKTSIIANKLHGT